MSLEITDLHNTLLTSSKYTTYKEWNNIISNLDINVAINYIHQLDTKEIYDELIRPTLIPKTSYYPLLLLIFKFIDHNCKNKLFEFSKNIIEVDTQIIPSKYYNLLLYLLSNNNDNDSSDVNDSNNFDETVLSFYRESLYGIRYIGSTLYRMYNAILDEDHETLLILLIIKDDCMHNFEYYKDNTGMMLVFFKIIVNNLLDELAHFFEGNGEHYYEGMIESVSAYDFCHIILHIESKEVLCIFTNAIKQKMISVGLNDTEHKFKDYKQTQMFICTLIFDIIDKNKTLTDEDINQIKQIDDKLFLINLKNLTGTQEEKYIKFKVIHIINHFFHTLLDDINGEYYIQSSYESYLKDIKTTLDFYKDVKIKKGDMIVLMINQRKCAFDNSNLRELEDTSNLKKNKIINFTNEYMSFCKIVASFYSIDDYVNLLAFNYDMEKKNGNLTKPAIKNSIK